MQRINYHGTVMLRYEFNTSRFPKYACAYCTFGSESTTKFGGICSSESATIPPPPYCEGRGGVQFIFLDRNQFKILNAQGLIKLLKR